MIDENDGGPKSHRGLRASILARFRELTTGKVEKLRFLLFLPEH